MSVNPLFEPPTLIKDLDAERVEKKTRYLIGSSLNNAPLNSAWWETAKVIKDTLRAQLVVIPTYYKNRAMREEGVSSSYWWPRQTKPYLAPNDLNIGKHLVVRGRVRIPHTAINPLGGMNHAGGKKSELFGHQQVAMQTVPLPHGMIPKLLHTTGTFSEPVTDPAWTAEKAGFHHSYSALFVETEGDEFWFTQVHFDGKGAYVYDRYFSPHGEQKGKKPEALVLGDLHVRFATDETIKAADALTAKLKPKRTVYHDAHDQHVGSHHNANSPLFNIWKNAEKEFSVRDELLMLRDYLDSGDRRDTGEMIIVDSNHNRHLDQWFDRFKPGVDPVNIDLYFEIGWLAVEDRIRGGDGNVLRLFLEKYGKKKITFVGPNDNLRPLDVDLTQHGDRGPNGSRGSARGFARTGQKSIIGHGHSPCIEKGCYQGGVMGRAPYACGYSSWLETHTVLAANGKRYQITVINGKLPPLLRK